MMAGTRSRQFWTELERSSPALFSRLGRAAEFSDRTGRPGPSTWELGAYPEGQAEYPVSGVSWFEAVAYCASMQKIVPSVFHWRKAFGEAFFMEVVTLGNFNGRGRGGREAEGPWTAWHVRHGGQRQRVGLERVPGQAVHPWRRMERTCLPWRRATMHGRRSIARRPTASDVRRKPARPTLLHSPRGGRRFPPATRPD